MSNMMTIIMIGEKMKWRAAGEWGPWNEVIMAGIRKATRITESNKSEGARLD